MFSGATLLPDQERLHSLLHLARQDRKKAVSELRSIEEERAKVQDRHAELQLQQKNLQELLDTLKVINNCNGNCNGKGNCNGNCNG